MAKSEHFCLNTQILEMPMVRDALEMAEIIEARMGHGEYERIKNLAEDYVKE